MKTILTEDQIAFIKANRLVMSGADMARRFGVSKNIVGNYMRKNGLSVPPEIAMQFMTNASRQSLSGKTTATPEQDLFLKEHYMGTPLKTMGKMIGRSDCFVRRRMQQLGLVQPRWLVEQFKKESRIKKGNVPFNKGKGMTPEVYERCKATMFKKGEPNHNNLYDGCITLRRSHQNRNDPPYYHIRLAKGKWRPLHQYNWENANGPIPAGHCLWCKDGNSLNADADNWELITRAENMRRNSCSKRLTDGYVAMTICGKNNMHLFEEVMKDKKLIEIKRQQILMNRKLREHGSYDPNANKRKAAKHEG